MGRVKILCLPSTWGVGASSHIHDSIIIRAADTQPVLTVDLLFCFRKILKHSFHLSAGEAMSYITLFCFFLRQAMKFCPETGYSWSLRVDTHLTLHLSLKDWESEETRHKRKRKTSKQSKATPVVPEVHSTHTPRCFGTGLRSSEGRRCHSSSYSISDKPT